MVQPTETELPSPETSIREELEETVNAVLADMQRFLPAEIDPMTLSAMRDYMMTILVRHQDFDRLLMRNTSIEILIIDATRRLQNLRSHAEALQAEFNFNHGGANEEAFLQRYNFTPEEFQHILRRNATLEAQMVVRDSEFMILRTLNQSLEQSFEQQRDILQRAAEERVQARRMIQQRDNELEEERERTKRVVERVERERDKANTTADYLLPQLRDLERRLEKAEKLCQASKLSVDNPMDARSQQGDAAAARAMPAPAGANTRPTGTKTQPGTDQEKDRESRRDVTIGPRSGSRFAAIFGQLTSNMRDSGNGQNTTEVKNEIKNRDASVENSVTTPKIIPCVPLLPPKLVMHASSSKEQHEQHDA